MKEYVAMSGGRNLYKTDILNLQDLALSATQLLSGFNNFVISGLSISGAVGNNTVDPGYLWLGGKIRYFAGATGVNLAVNNYIVANNSTESVKYSGGDVKQGVGVYGSTWTTTTPAADDERIQLPIGGSLPRINDNFFGKHCVLSAPNAASQHINKPLRLNDTLEVRKEVTLGHETNDIDLSINRYSAAMVLSQIKQTIGADGTMSTIYSVNNGERVRIKVTPDSNTLTVVVDDEDRLSISSSGVTLHNVNSLGDITNSKVFISNDSINNKSGDIDSAELKLNLVGYNGGTTRFRDLSIYDGKGSLVGKFTGQSKAFYINGSIIHNSNGDVGMYLDHSSKVRTDSSYSKYISWRDMNGDPMCKVGYESAAGRHFVIDNETIDDIEVRPKQYFKSSQPIMEQGSVLSDKYADKATTLASIANKVDKSGTKVLTDVNFTAGLSTKLNNIFTGSVTAGNGGYVTGGAVATSLEAKADKASNCSDMNAASVRANISVQSTSESDAKYAQVNNNCSDMNAASVRANINSPAIGDSYLKSETYTKTEVHTKAEVASIYQPILSDTGYVDCLNPEGTNTNFKIKARFKGGIVNIVGSVDKLSTGQVLFALPAQIPAPLHDIGQVTDVDTGGGHRDNRGMAIICEAGTKDFVVRNEYDAENKQYVCITYMV